MIYRNTKTQVRIIIEEGYLESKAMKERNLDKWKKKQKEGFDSERNWNIWNPRTKGKDPEQASPRLLVWTKKNSRIPKNMSCILKGHTSDKSKLSKSNRSKNIKYSNTAVP